MITVNPLLQSSEAFLRFLQVERQLSGLTIKVYRRQLNVIAEILTEQGVERWATVESKHIRAMAAKSRSLGLQSASLAIRLSALRSFLDWQVQHGLLLANPAKGIATPRSGRHLPKNIDVDDIHQLLNLTDNNPLTVRDRAMLEVMYGAGLRLSELVNLDCRQLALETGELWVIGKGNRERRLPIGRTALTWLNAWLRLRAMFKPDTDAVFLAKSGKRISTRNVQKRFAEWGVKQGMNHHLHPHKLRHSFASHMLESSGDLRAVQELLGHANLSTTQIYTHLNFQHLASVYDAAHPRAKREK